MAGHSKWHQIRHKKAANDSKMGKVFTKHAKLITLAARSGPDPDLNPTLRAAINNAKVDNVPNANIERAIKKASGEGGEALQMSEVFYEGFGPEGVAIYVQVITDNKNRSYTSVRNIFAKNGGNLGQPGSVGWMFQKRGSFLVELGSMDKEEAELVLIESGAEDFQELENELLVYTEAQNLHETTETAKQNGLSIKQAEITYVPTQTVEVTESEAAQKVLDFIEKLEDDDDVQAVYMNMA